MLAAGLAWAVTIGTTPSTITPSAPADTIVPNVDPVSDSRRVRRQVAGCSRARQPAVARAGSTAGAGAVAGAVAGARARYAVTASSANGIMLFGSVPSPPKNPRSSTSTQSARPSARNATTAGRASSRRPARPPTRNATATAPITMTATRLTANPCARASALNPDTSVPIRCGCEITAICWTMPASVLPEPPGSP